jgi:glycosyltransferase involved in cell wall biosynthesis
MPRITTRAKYLYDGSVKFYAKGVSYGPFAPNSRGERYPEPDRTDTDFELMREIGVNVVRTYVLPPGWMFEKAAAHGLRLMVGIPWPFHMAFLDSKEMSRDIRREIRRGVAEVRQYREAIFAYTVGNEIRSDIVRWHGSRAVNNFLRELYDIGKSLDPEGLFTYANYPSAEYLELNFLDFLSFNVYLHREADFRRYLTHLLASSGDRPVVLSETGMDTIREGEAHQADLLEWQSRAAFETGLSGFIVFAFTDSWHTGGAEITDWAFGLVTRERIAKRGFSAVAKTFNSSIPAGLVNPPMVSVIVACYNAADTLRACLGSLRAQNYPSYEVIVVDDGSRDLTSSIANEFAVRVLRAEHQGLAGARNLGVAQSRGSIIAFIDADAVGDRDWLYHLVETIVRRDCVAAGGPNFPPDPESALMAAIAVAPGAPREVRIGDENLLQLCGCNMAIRRAALDEVGGFDPLFATAGDDVDLSVKLRARDGTLACAPAATVIHQRRRTIRGYLAQQRGYGAGEARLFLKYPRLAIDASIYGTPPTLGSIFRIAMRAPGPRVYYGAFGRGLFQTVYPDPFEAPLPAAVLSVFWVAACLGLLVIGAVGRATGMLNSIPLCAGVAGVAASIAAACLSASAPGDLSFLARLWLALMSFGGPLVRTYARARGIYLPGSISGKAPEGEREPVPIAAAQDGQPLRSTDPIGRVRDVLVRSGIAAARGEPFASSDLRAVIPPALEVPINVLTTPDRKLVLKWSLKLDWMVVAEVLIACALFILIGARGWLRSWMGYAAIVGPLAVGFSALCAARLRRLAAMLEAAAAALNAPRAEVASPVTESVR